MVGVVKAQYEIPILYKNKGTNNCSISNGAVACFKNLGMKREELFLGSQIAILP